MDSDSKPPVSPGIYFIPTPIGNLADITLRALDILKNCDLIVCEDTRRSRKLLHHFEIKKPLLALHDHNETQRAPQLLASVSQGQCIALITDAGTPGISDPGYQVIQQCQASGTPYTVLPGPSAITTALVGSGFPPHPFYFGGFLPVKKSKRRNQLTNAIGLDHTSLFFESPHRLLSTLQILIELAPQVRLCIARELTKKFETYHRATPPELHQHFTTHPAKGEIVLLLDPRPIPFGTNFKL